MSQTSSSFRPFFPQLACTGGEDGEDRQRNHRQQHQHLRGLRSPHNRSGFVSVTRPMVVVRWEPQEHSAPTATKHPHSTHYRAPKKIETSMKGQGACPALPAILLLQRERDLATLSPKGYRP